jgi:glutathione S-transferase
VPSEDVEVIPATIAAQGAPAEAPGKPPGSVPLLALGDGTYDHESLTIIKYFEDLAESKGLPTLRGHTPEDRARVRETLGLAQEVTLALELAAVHGCVIFRSADRKPAECDYCQVHAQALSQEAVQDGGIRFS